MTVDLGAAAGLATAIGLLDGDGDLVEDWFSRPGDHLSSVLAADHQRAALLDFTDEALGAGTETTDAAGRRWIPLVDVEDGTFTAAAVVEELPDRIHLGVGVRIRRTAQSGVGLAVDLVVPLFATARAGTAGTTTPVEPVLLGTPAGDIELDLTLDLPDGQVAGSVGLDRARLGARIPTAAGDDPAFRLALEGLALPGASAPRDIVVDADTVDELDDAVLDLLLGLVRAVAADPGVAGPFAGLATMIGLGYGDGVPDFPIADLRSRGAVAIADWLASALGEPVARAAWMGGLATLVGAPAPVGDTVEIDAGDLHVRLGVTVEPGTAGRPRLTPRIELATGGAGGGGGADGAIELALAAEPITLDLGTGTARALPSLAATVRIGVPGSDPLLVGGSAGGLAIAVGSLEAGLGLDDTRRPKLVLTAHDADVGATHFDSLDLSSPEALAAAAEDVVTDAAGRLLGQLGPVGQAVAVLIGLADPPGPGPAPPRVDAGALLADPLGALAGHWRVLLADHAARVPDVLEVLRDAVASAPVATRPVDGDGTEADPWRVPLAEGVDLVATHVAGAVAAGLEAAVGTDDVAGSGLGAELAVRATIVELDLAARRASFLPAVDGRLELSGPAGDPLVLGTGQIGASAEALGLALRWRAGEGIAGRPVAVAPQLLLLGGSVPLPQLVRDADGRLTLDAAGWAAVEMLLGAVGQAAGTAIGVTWPGEVARLLGWLPGADGSTAGPHLELALLLDDPEATLAGFVRSLLAVGEDSLPVQRLLDLLAAIVAGPLGQRLGAGRPDAPWHLPLTPPAAPGDIVAGLIAALGPAGPDAPPTVVSGALRAWQPGDPGFDPTSLLAELTYEATLDGELADLLHGRGDVVTGMDELVERFAGTDGLVALPDGAVPAGVGAHRVADLAHTAPLGELDLAQVLGGPPPATVVYVAVAAPGIAADDVLSGGPLDGVAAGRVIDLTGADLPPEAFTAPAAAPGVWVIRLGARADCRLPTGDDDGVAGQAARLRRVVGPLAQAGAVLVAHGGAGHAAIRAAAGGGLPGLAAVVTVGTPWSAVSVDVLDRPTSGQAVRLLAALVPPVDDGELDDPDLALARRLVDGLLALDPLDDPLRELRPPAGLVAPGGVAVHAVVGSLAAPTILRALTAACAATLAARAVVRAEAALALPTATEVGVGFPLVPLRQRGGLLAGVGLELDLVGVPADPTAPPTGPTLVVRTELSAASGWLVGGPDPGRQVGVPRPLALRRLTATVRVPLGGAGGPGGAGARTTLVLHDATVFGVARARWVVDVVADAPVGATGLLPEVRALVGEAVRGFTVPAGVTPDPGLVALRDALTALGMLDPAGGADPVTLERLLFDPAATAGAALDDPARRSALAAALRTLAGDDRADPGDTVRVRAATAGGEAAAPGAAPSTTGFVADLDLAARSVNVSATGQGAIPWAAGLTLTGGVATADVRLGPDLPAPTDPAAADRQAAPGLVLLVGAAPLTARLRVRHPGRSEDVVLWPAPDGAALADALAQAAPAALVHLLLDGLRATLSDAVPAAGTVVDALLDALGLLAPLPPLPTSPPGAVVAAGDGDGDGETPLRPLRLPVTLLRDPAAWLASLPGAAGPSGLVALVPAVLDALRGLLGAPGGPGTLEITDGVVLRATATDGRLTLGVDLDATAFPAPAGGLPLLVGGGAGLSVGPTGGAVPDLQLSVTVPGTGAVRLGVGPGPGGPLVVSLVLAPDGGPEIPLLPAGPGLGGLASAAGALAVRALPPLLDALAEHDPTAGVPDEPLGVAGRLVARLGDALALRIDDATAPGGRRFDGDALATFGHDPAAALAARAASLTAAGLGLLEDAVGPLLQGGAGRSVTVDSGALVVAVGGLTVRWRPGTTRVEVTVAVTGVPGVSAVQASTAVDATGLVVLDVAVGPAELTAGPVTLRPYARCRAGSAVAGGPLVETGLGVGGAGDDRLALRWNPTTGAVALLAIAGAGGPSPVESTAPGDVAAVVLGVVVDLAGSVVLALEPVGQALTTPVLGTTAKELLTGVALADQPVPRLVPGLLDPATVPQRLATLLGNLADAEIGVTIADALTLRAHRASAGGVDSYGLTLSLAKPFPLGGDDVTITLEDEASWIRPPSGSVAEGLTVTVLSVGPGSAVAFQPGVTVGGIGVRLGRGDGPLVDAGITLESLAVHLFADVRAGTGGAAPSLAGGARLELAGLAVPMAGAAGGDNAVAKGLLSSGGNGSNGSNASNGGGAGGGTPAPQPRFSPFVAVQKHPGQPVMVTLSAGPGSGPWWLVIQRAFGPVYVEQVGFEVTMEQDRIGSFGLLIDGKVSLLGLTAAVDDLRLTYLVSSGRSVLDPSAWRADLAGFAVTSDIGGLTLAGGLRKFPVGVGGVEYLGLLQARFGVYGIAVYGGYGLVGPQQDQFAALFLFGAVNGPIGGPPAFFVTGIGGGFGINRALAYPGDLSQFGTYPFIKALDPGARPGDPMAELEQVRGFFPAQRGTFWFAAGLSFNSFALVDGIAVVAVQIGQGFELTLLGLARMALPRPQAALVSVELGLLARFSTREGLLLVQAQLTDNSWLLYPSVRLSGGFAFATWFRGPNRGQFVLTLGGYHPSFRREGYPQVPRLGIAWRVSSAINIVGESYFALTSEAVMAGARIEASARFGPAWASLEVGGDGIVFFDPFWLTVTVYARISAGVTIDVWIGEITIRVSLSAEVTLEGPPFHGRARFSVGPVGLTVEFGDRPTRPRELDWNSFVAKYLEEAAPGHAHVLAAVPGQGAVPPAGDAASGGARSPDGSDARPFRVVPEFELTVTSTAPIRELVVGDAALRNLPTVPEVSAAPMRKPARPRVTLGLRGPDGDATDRIGRLANEPQKLGAFAIGTWGPAQSQDAPKVPRGDVLAAVDRVLLRGEATIALPTSGTAPAIKYRQVETGARRPLPFVVEYTPERQDQLVEGATGLAGLVPPVGEAGTVPVAADLLAVRAGRGAADVAAWSGARVAAPLLGSLAEGLGGPIQLVDVDPTLPPLAPEPPPPRPPTVAAVLSSPATAPPVEGRPLAPGRTTTVDTELRTRLADEFRLVGTAPPQLEGLDRGLDPAAPARLLRVPLPAADVDRTVLAVAAPPTTRTGRPGAEAIAGRGAGAETNERLRLLDERLLGAGADLTDGDVAVLRLPDAGRDVDPDPVRRPRLAVGPGRARVVAVLPGSVVAADEVLEDAELAVPPGTRTVVCLAGLPDEDVNLPVAGWVAGTPVAYVGDEVWVGAGVTARSTGRVPARGLADAATGWVAPDALVAGDTAVVTSFADPVSVVAVAVEGGSPAADDIALGLAGARRPTDAGGRAHPPVVVADGPRTVAVFAIEPATGGDAGDGEGGPITVTVVTGSGRRLAGVAGTTGTDPERLAAAVAARGLDDLVPPAVADGLGRARITWKER